MEVATVSKKQGFVARMLSKVGLKRSSTVHGSSPFSAWQKLFQSWGIDSTPLSAESAQSIPAFNRAVEIVSDQLASLPISVWMKNEKGEVVEATNHPFHKLLKFRPHPLFSSFDFRAALVRQLMINGNCYVLPTIRKGEIVSLEFVEGAPSIFKVKERWFYRFASLSRPVRVEEIFHFKKNSYNGIVGQGAIDLFDKTLERGLAEIDQGNAYFKNGGQVSGLLTPSQPLDKRQSEQAMDFWAKNNVGADKVGKVGMVPFGFNYLRLGDSIADSKLLEARRMTVEDVSNMTGVHPILLGNLAKATFSNVEELNRILVQFTLRNMAKILEEEINSKAFSSDEVGTYFVRFNFDGLLRGDTAARADFYTKLYNINSISANEIREMENRNPYEGGDEFGAPLASNTRVDTPAKKDSDGEV